MFEHGSPLFDVFCGAVSARGSIIAGLASRIVGVPGADVRMSMFVSVCRG